MVLFEEYEIKKTKKEKKKSPDKEAINIIRTNQRNNVELTHLADNKANVLLSLNAIMLTFLIPSVVSNTDFIVEKHLLIPLIILALTCFSTIYISTMVLKPSRLDKSRYFKSEFRNKSPLFYGNIYKMTPGEFFESMDNRFSSKKQIMANLQQDLFYSGKRLAYKMNWITRAFDWFLIGLSLSIISSALAFLLG